MKRSILFGAIGAVVLVGAGVWWFFLRSDAPPPASLDDAIAAVTSTTESPTTTQADAAGGTTAPTSTQAPATTQPAAPSGDGLDGTWTVDTANSFVGYRVVEELARVGVTEAVGRTSDLEGSLTLQGSSITAVEMTVDMTTLESDSRNRDSQMRSQALETNAFPTATFSLTAPIELGSVPSEGEPITANATGALTIHGVTNEVTIPLEAQLVGGTIVAVGSIDIVFADYDITPPSAFSVVSVEDHGLLEMQLAFIRA